MRNIEPLDMYGFGEYFAGWAAADEDAIYYEEGSAVEMLAVIFSEAYASYMSEYHPGIDAGDVPTILRMISKWSEREGHENHAEWLLYDFDGREDDDAFEAKNGFYPMRGPFTPHYISSRIRLLEGDIEQAEIRGRFPQKAILERQLEDLQKRVKKISDRTEQKLNL